MFSDNTYSFKDQMLFKQLEELQDVEFRVAKRKLKEICQDMEYKLEGRQIVDPVVNNEVVAVISCSSNKRFYWHRS